MSREQKAEAFTATLERSSMVEGYYLFKEIKIIAYANTPPHSICVYVFQSLFYTRLVYIFLKVVISLNVRSPKLRGYYTNDKSDTSVYKKNSLLGF